jgi:hypothetical protein
MNTEAKKKVPANAGTFSTHKVSRIKTLPVKYLE